MLVKELEKLKLSIFNSDWVEKKLKTSNNFGFGDESDLNNYKSKIIKYIKQSKRISKIESIYANIK